MRNSALANALECERPRRDSESVKAVFGPVTAAAQYKWKDKERKKASEKKLTRFGLKKEKSVLFSTQIFSRASFYYSRF